MAIFNSYVKLPEGIIGMQPEISPLCSTTHFFMFFQIRHEQRCDSLLENGSFHDRIQCFLSLQVDVPTSHCVVSEVAKAAKN